MASEPGFPILMQHPQHQPAQVMSEAEIKDGALPGRPERFPPVEVHSADQEEQMRARGYMRYGESMEKVATFNEFPKMMNHPQHVDAVLPSQGARVEDGKMITFPIPGQPERFPSVVVNDEKEQAAWEAKGYEAPNTFDPIAYEKATLAPGKPGDEWPKWVDGVLTQDPDAPQDLTGQYPKWLHFEGGDSVLVNDESHERRVLANRGEALPEKQAPKPYIEPELQKVSDHDYAEFLAWKAAKAAAPDEQATRDKLREDAKALGIDVDLRWGIGRLQAEIDGALERSAA